MKVLLVGHFENIWSTNNEMLKSFSRLGDKVTIFDYRKIANQNIKSYEKNFIFLIINKILSFSRRIPLLRDNIGKIYYNIMGRGDMLNKLNKLRDKKFDLVMFLKTDTVDPLIVKKFSKKFKTWYYFMDPPYVAYRINVFEYVKYATYASSTFPDLFIKFKKINKNSFHIRQGFDEKVFKKRKRKKNIDFLFVGTKDKKREKIVNYLNKYFRVRCYGLGWENEPIFSHKLNNLYNSSKIILNFNRNGDGFSVRIFQILGSGSFVISEYTKDLKKLFKNKYHIIWYYNLKQLKKLCNFYLNHRAEREKISANAYKEAKKKYTWNKIIKEIKNKTYV